MKFIVNLITELLDFTLGGVHNCALCNFKYITSRDRLRHRVTNSNVPSLVVVGNNRRRRRPTANRASWSHAIGNEIVGNTIIVSESDSGRRNFPQAIIATICKIGNCSNYRFASKAKVAKKEFHFHSSANYSGCLLTEAPFNFVTRLSSLTSSTSIFLLVCRLRAHLLANSPCV